jgi:hypothetical protein
MKKSFKAAGLRAFNACGSASIQPTWRSLQRDFVINGKGYFLVHLPEHKVYRRILEEWPAGGAREKLQEAFAKTELWVRETGSARKLDAPARVEFRFSTSVRDCVETGKHALVGGSCQLAQSERRACCWEKFPGIGITWALAEGDFVLGYAPDPSVRLRVPGEANHRFCNVVKKLRVL